MRAFACALAISLSAASPAGAAPQRVASLKLCTDELLLLLAEPAQIASITYLSREQRETPLWRQARRYHSNDGSLLSVVAARPDLVIDMGGGGRDTQRIAARLGIRILMLPYPQSLSDIEESIARVAHAIGHPEAGLAARNRIRALMRTVPTRKIDAAWISGGGRSLGATGLGAEWMGLIGLRQQSLPGDRVTIEHMLGSPPKILLRSDYRSDQYSSDQKWLDQPLLKQNRTWRTIPTDGRRWTCMGPLMIDEIIRLRRAIAR
jgi:iron complex transport system substrate-binding protein